MIRDAVERQREYARCRSAERFKAGLCIICGQEWRGRCKTCEACRARIAERSKARRNALKAQVAATGMCCKCGQKPARAGRLMCPLCAFLAAERANRYKAKRSAEAKANGLCERCMNAPARQGRTTCAECAARESKRYKEYRIRKKAEVEA